MAEQEYLKLMHGIFGFLSKKFIKGQSDKNQTLKDSVMKPLVYPVEDLSQGKKIKINK